MNELLQIIILGIVDEFQQVTRDKRQDGILPLRYQRPGRGFYPAAIYRSRDIGIITICAKSDCLLIYGEPARLFLELDYNEPSMIQQALDVLARETV